MRRRASDYRPVNSQEVPDAPQPEADARSWAASTSTSR